MRRLGTLKPKASPSLVLLALVALALASSFAPSSLRVVGAVIAAFLALVTVCVLLLPSRLVARDTVLGELNPEQRAAAVNSARTTLVQGLVGLAALAGIFVAWQQLQIDREQARTDRQQLTEQLTLTRQGQVAGRFTSAVSQLGSDKLEQRLGGIYGLERIAEESTSTRLQVFEVLTAFVRRGAARDRTAAESTGGTELNARAPDMQAIVTVLGRRTVSTKDPPLDLTAADLRRAQFRGLNFQRAILSGAQLQNADLSGAQLHPWRAVGARGVGGFQPQNADLRGVQGQNARLNGANLQEVVLGFAEFRGANFSGARLTGANLIGARLQRANLSGAQLEEALLYDANLQNAILSDAQLKGAFLDRAQLQGARLDNAQLQGAYHSAKTVWPTGFDWKAAGVRPRR
jgi:uncharacterized protein YjbI with pentapeptide repeats